MSKPITFPKELRELAAEKGRTLFAFGVDSGPNMSGVSRYSFFQTGAVPHELAEKMLASVAGMYKAWLEAQDKPEVKKQPKRKRGG